MKSLKEIAAKLNPKAVVPIHTENQEGYEMLGKKVRVMWGGVEEEI